MEYRAMPSTTADVIKIHSPECNAIKGHRHYAVEAVDAKAAVANVLAELEQEGNSGYTVKACKCAQSKAETIEEYVARRREGMSDDDVRMYLGLL